MIDGKVLPAHPLERIAAGSAAGVDVLVGTNTEEMKMFLLMEPSLAELEEASFSIRADELVADRGHEPGDALRTYRADRPDAPLADVLSALMTDHTFRIPAIHLAEAQLGQHAGVWMYLFAYRSPAFGGALGSCHALEIPFVWDNLDAEGAAMFAGEPTAGMRALAARMADAWVAFATSGSPTLGDGVEWPAYDLERRATARFDVAGADDVDITIVDDPEGHERRLWV